GGVGLQPVQCRLLGRGVQGQHDRGALRIGAGQHVQEVADHEAVVGAVEVGVVGLLDAEVAHRVEHAHRVRVQLSLRILALVVLLLLVEGRGGDLLVAHHDGAARQGGPLGHVAAVELVLAEPVGLERLDPGGVEQQHPEQRQGEHRESANGLVHREITWVAPSSWMATGAGLRALLLIRTSRASMIQLDSRAEPPLATKGMVAPVIGMTRVTPPMTTKVWKAMRNEIPEANILTNSSREASAMRMPRCASSASTSSITIRPVRPSSSPNALKMKSFCTSGTWPGLPPPSPAPRMPPSPIAKRPCTSCWLFWPACTQKASALLAMTSSVQNTSGLKASSQVTTRVRKCGTNGYSRAQAPKNALRPRMIHEERCVAT